MPKFFITLLVFLFTLLAVPYIHAQTPGPCRNNPVNPPKSDNPLLKYKWEADCDNAEPLCQANADCPAADDPKLSGLQTNWCYGFDEGNRCMVLKAKKLITMTEKRLKKMREYQDSLMKFHSTDDKKVIQAFLIAKNLLDDGTKKAEGCLKLIQSKAPSAERAQCKAEVKTIYGKVKAAVRVTKYYAILGGFSSTCVEADLGMEPRLAGTSIDKAAELRRLLFCSGKENSKEALNIKFRVKSKDNKKLIRTKEEFSLDVNNLPNKAHLGLAEKLIGL